jgi:hypothetical protein
MRRVTSFVAVLMLFGAGCAAPESPPPTPAPVSAPAATHAPCDYHGASTPYILLVDSTSATGENVTLTELSAARSIGGCPVVATTEPESVAITVCPQRLDPVTAAWVESAPRPERRSTWTAAEPERPCVFSAQAATSWTVRT